MNDLLRRTSTWRWAAMLACAASILAFAQNPQNPGPPAGTPGVTGGSLSGPSGSTTGSKDVSPGTSGGINSPNSTWGYGGMLQRSAPAAANAKTAVTAAGPGGRSTVRSIADGNGNVSRARLLELVGERFDAADKSKQGRLPIGEVERITKELAQP